MYLDAEGRELANTDAESGLYIRSRTGETVKAVIPADCLAFQLGETTQIHSCGVLHATPHCVRAGRTPNVSRETFAVFMEPEMSVAWREGGKVEGGAGGAARSRAGGCDLRASLRRLALLQRCAASCDEHV
jgi:hypothetical protein